MTDQDVVLNALADVTGSILGAQGNFSNLSRERTEEILLLLLRSGRRVKAHDRVWSIPISAEDEPMIRAAGGYLTLTEWNAAMAERCRVTGRTKDAEYYEAMAAKG